MITYLCYILLTVFAPVVDSLLHVYDQELNRDGVYKQQREQKIANAKDYDELASLYWSYQCDSALKYLSYSQSKMSTIKSAYLLASIGEYANALELIGQVQPTRLTNKERVWYYETLYHLYGEQAFYCKQASFSQGNGTKEQEALDSLRHYIRITGIRPDYRYSTYEKEAAGFYPATPSEDKREYAVYAYEQSILYRGVDSEQETGWLLRSAISDVRCGITDNGAAWMVAQWVYEQGDVQRAYQYIMYALHNADIYNAALRKGQVAQVMNIIATAHEQQQQVQHRKTVLALITTMSLAMMLLFLLCVVLRLTRKRKILNEQLAQANYIKEEYITHYLTIYSQCIYRMRKMVKDASFMEQEMKQFYQHFDKTFLSIYPDFVEQMNALLDNEAQISLKRGEWMNTELRIYALYRLGIQSSAKIAELLCYSPSTIYNYRTRLSAHTRDKSRSLDEQIMHIGTFTS